MTTHQRLTVLGTGSVGLAVAAAFSQAGHSVTLLARGDALGLLRSEGIRVTGVSGEHTIAPTAITVDDAGSPGAASLACDVLIVATKAYQVTEALRAAVAQWQTAGLLPMVYEPAIEPAMLNKFLFNSCLNAAGALTGQTYGELVTHPHSRQLIVRLADEAIRVLDAARRYQAAAGNGARYVEDVLTPFVVPRAAAHRSSMLQDVAAGRRTEIDYLNGAIVRMGSAHGMETPFNQALVSLIHARDRSAFQAQVDVPPPIVQPHQAQVAADPGGDA